MQLTLPFPPSLNHLYATGSHGRRFLSKRGKLYHKAVAEAVLLYRAQFPEECAAFGEARLYFWLGVYCPDRRRRDLTNMPKVIEDALDEVEVFGDDSQIDEVKIWRRPEIVKPGHVVVTLGRIEVIHPATTIV